MRRTKRYKQWEAKVASWQREYGVTQDFDLTKLSSVRICNKCGRNDRVLQRNHKGHEYLFATILPEKYARRYSEFRREDIILLCRVCHRRCDKTHYPIIAEMFKAMAANGGQLSYQSYERWRKKLVARTNAWLVRGNKLARKLALVFIAMLLTASCRDILPPRLCDVAWTGWIVNLGTGQSLYRTVHLKMPCADTTAWRERYGGS